MKTFPTTPFDWFNYTAQNYNSNALIQFVVKFDSLLDVDLLKRALRNCMEADPILKCRFVVKEDVPEWEEMEQKESDLCKKIETEQIKEEVDHCLTEKIDVSKECPIKLYVIENRKETYLVIKVHHAFCDAAGALQFVRMLAAMYAKVEENVDFVEKCGEPCRGTESFYEYFKITDKASLLNLSLLPDMRSTWGTPFENFTSAQSFAYQTIRLTKVQMDHIINVAKTNESSLNAVLTSAFHRALTILLKPIDANKEIQFSANLRNYTKGRPNTSCNLSNLFNVKLPTEVSFIELVRQSKRLIDEVLDPEIVLQMVLACELMSTSFKTLDSFYAADWENVKQTGNCTPMISNIGRLDNEQICFGQCEVTDMIFVSPAFVSPSFMLSVSTYRHVMTFCVAYQKPSMDDEFVASLLAKMKKILIEI